MLSIGEFAKEAQVSARTVRHYESIGLIRASLRGENNYRYFDKTELEKMVKIRDLQSLGFTLEEVREVLALGAASMTDNLKKRLREVEVEVLDLSMRRDRLKNLLSISQRVDSLQAVRLHERKLFMEALKEQVIQGLQSLQVPVTEDHLVYLTREQEFYNSPEKLAFVEAIQKMS